MTREALINHGYRQFPVNEFLNPHAVANYQLLVQHGTERNKLYFITVFEYKRHLDGEPVVATFQAECQFTNENGGTFNVSLFDWDTVKELNAFFANVYHNMNCRPYSN
jgi:hypothetical protein